MDLRRLQTFVIVAELGTVSKAASHLRISQSALSRRIGELEEEFDLKLFDRIGRRLVLTAAGEQLLADSREVLVLCQPCSDVFRADLLPRGMAVGGGGGEAVPGDVDGGGA
jgi:DNA-binding transcriptional LysR family regulator